MKAWVDLFTTPSVEGTQPVGDGAAKQPTPDAGAFDALLADAVDQEAARESGVEASAREGGLPDVMLPGRGTLAQRADERATMPARALGLHERLARQSTEVRLAPVQTSEGATDVAPLARLPVDALESDDPALVQAALGEVASAIARIAAPAPAQQAAQSVASPLAAQDATSEAPTVAAEVAVGTESAAQPTQESTRQAPPRSTPLFDRPTTPAVPHARAVAHAPHLAAAPLEAARRTTTAGSEASAQLPFASPNAETRPHMPLPEGWVPSGPASDTTRARGEGDELPAPRSAQPEIAGAPLAMLAAQQTAPSPTPVSTRTQDVGPVASASFHTRMRGPELPTPFAAAQAEPLPSTTSASGTSATGFSLEPARALTPSAPVQNAVPSAPVQNAAPPSASTPLVTGSATEAPVIAPDGHLRSWGDATPVQGSRGQAPFVTQPDARSVGPRLVVSAAPTTQVAASPAVEPAMQAVQVAPEMRVTVKMGPAGPAVAPEPAPAPRGVEATVSLSSAATQPQQPSLAARPRAAPAPAQPRNDVPQVAQPPLEVPSTAAPSPRGVSAAVQSPSASFTTSEPAAQVASAQPPTSPAQPASAERSLAQPPLAPAAQVAPVVQSTQPAAAQVVAASVQQSVSTATAPSEPTTSPKQRAASDPLGRVEGFTRGAIASHALSAYGGRGHEGAEHDAPRGKRSDEGRERELSREGQGGMTTGFDPLVRAPEQVMAPQLQREAPPPELAARMPAVPVASPVVVPDVDFQAGTTPAAQPKDASISLHHPDLGPIRLEVHREQGRVEVHAVIETAHAAAVLRANENGIRQGVQQSGMALGALRVRMRGEEPQVARTAPVRRRRTSEREA